MMDVPSVGLVVGDVDGEFDGALEMVAEGTSEGGTDGTFVDNDAPLIQQSPTP